MIGSLSGTVTVKDTHYLLLDVQGVGYKVFVPQAILVSRHVGDSLKVFTYLHVRDDMLDLYGFEAFVDLKLFEMLISVSGIGPKTVLGIFGLGTPDMIIKAIASGDVSFFTGVPRLGKKNAQKIIIELKSKIGATQDLDLSQESIENDDVIEALTAFGFSKQEALQALQKVDKNAPMEEKIKLALKNLGK